MFVNTKTRSGRLASQYKFQSAIKTHQKKPVIKENTEVNNRNKKVTAKNKDNSPDKINVKNSSETNIRKAELVSVVYNTRQQPKQSTSTTLIDKKSTKGSRLADKKEGTKVEKNSRKVKATKNENTLKDNISGDGRKRGGRIIKKGDLFAVTDAKQAAGENTAVLHSPINRSKLSQSDKEPDKENDVGNIRNRREIQKINPSSSITSIKRQTRNSKKPNLVEPKSVYVICEKTVSAKTDVPEKSYISPSCVITYNATVEKAIEDLITIQNDCVEGSMPITNMSNEEKSDNKIILKNGKQKPDGMQQKGKTMHQMLTEEWGETEDGFEMDKRNNLRSRRVNNNLYSKEKQVNEQKMENEKINIRGKRNQKKVNLNTSDSRDKNDNNNIKTIAKRLRFQKKCNYNEISLSNSQDSINNTVVEKVDHQPIYKNKIISPKKQIRGKKDVYEFKEDLEKSVSEGEFEKGTASFIKELEQQFNKEKRNKKPKRKANRKPNTNKKIVNKPEIDLRNKSYNCRKKIETVKNTQDVKDTNYKITEDKKHLVNAVTITDNVNDKTQKDTNPKIKNKQINDIEIEIIGGRDSSNSNNTLLSSSNQGSSRSFQLFNSPVHIPSPTESNKSSPTRILSNILVRNSSTFNDTISFNESLQLNFKKPNANSTMFIQKSPWRPTVALKSNPLFLATKKSSLPNYDQDMVINFKMLDKSYSTPIKIHDNTKVQVDSPLKRTKQASIINYMNSSIPIEPTQDENRFNYSLFDADQLSPVKKSRSPRNNILKDCTNIIPSKKNLLAFNVKDSNRLPFSKKLSPLIDNLNDRNKCPSSPAKIDDPFSFSDDERVSPIKEGGKPTRLSVNEVKKCIFRDVKVRKKFTVPVPATTVDGVKETTENVEISVQNDVPIVGLFEDFKKEKVPPKATYGRLKGRTKRVRYVSVNEECADETGEHTKKRRKDVRTKAEELEAERWAAKFNEMCKEIDDYQLTLEK